MRIKKCFLIQNVNITVRHLYTARCISKGLEITGFLAKWITLLEQAIRLNFRSHSQGLSPLVKKAFLEKSVKPNAENNAIQHSR